ncbi:hypothetical protein GCM10023116_23890 [Kistimonas scapharcae]|uniref:Uncharacterized protein n=1 Tax=Kistimonas scapharcae TaxID=1036133 RepID=A0ABP8V4A5_9GAMM
MSIEKRIESIRAGGYSKQQLVALYKNASKPSVNAEDRARIHHAIEQYTRYKFPRTANALFGAKDSDIREMLTRYHKALSERFDLSGNCHKDGVKTGGDVINGKAYLDIYLSYRRKDGHAVSLGFYQESFDRDPVFNVKRYHKGLDTGLISQERFVSEYFDKASASFEQHLAALVSDLKSGSGCDAAGVAKQ